MDGDDGVLRDPVDAEEVFEIIRHVVDPEHPLTLEQLKIVKVSSYFLSLVSSSLVARR